MRDRDPHGYYAALNVSPDASAEEIRLSYEFLKRDHLGGKRVPDIPRILAAYETLSNPATRTQYNNGGTTSKATTPAQALARIKPLLGSTITLGVAVVVFLGVVGLTFAPEWTSELRSYSPGDELVWKDSGKPIGRVVAFESRHEFAGGIRADGYRIQPEQGEPVWMPAGDLKRHGARRSGG